MCFTMAVGEMKLYCIYDSAMGVVIEVGFQETMRAVVINTYNSDFQRYKVMIWEG